MTSHFFVYHDSIRMFLSELRTVAKWLRLPRLPSVQTNKPLETLFDVHGELISDGVMNWGRMLYFLRFAEEFHLSEEEWSSLFDFLSEKHPEYFP